MTFTQRIHTAMTEDLIAQAVRLDVRVSRFDTMATWRERVRRAAIAEVMGL